MASEYDILFATPAEEKQGVAGQLEAGNIDLTNRPVVENADGSISTVKSMSSNIDGQEVLLPTISDKGEQLTNDQAIENYKTTGKHLGKFDTPENATAFAEQLHKDQAERYGRPGSTKGSEYDILFQTPAPDDRRFSTNLGDIGREAVGSLAGFVNNLQNLGKETLTGFLPDAAVEQLFGGAVSSMRPEERAKPAISPKTAGNILDVLGGALTGGVSAVEEGKLKGAPPEAPTEFAAGGKERLAETASQFSTLPALGQAGLFAIPGVAENFVVETIAKVPDQIKRITDIISKHGINSKEAGAEIIGDLSEDIMAIVAGKTGTGARAFKGRAPEPPAAAIEKPPVQVPPPAAAEPVSVEARNAAARAQMEEALGPAPAEAPAAAPAPVVAGEGQPRYAGEVAALEGARVSEGDVEALRAENAARLAEGEQPVPAGESALAPTAEAAGVAQAAAEPVAGGEAVGKGITTAIARLEKELKSNYIGEGFTDQQAAAKAKADAGHITTPEEVALPEEAAAPAEAVEASTRTEAPVEEVVTEIPDAAPEQAAAVERVSGDTEQSNFIGAQAELARNRIEGAGPGAAAAEEFPLLREQNARDYAAIGAQHLLEGAGDKATWVERMRDEYGICDASPAELNRIWQDSHALLSDFEAAQKGGGGRTKTQIEEATGIRKPEEPTVKESAALKAKLQAEQKAAAQGFREGKRSVREKLNPIITRLRDTLENSVSKARAFVEMLRSEQRGGRIGSKIKERQMQMADNELSANQEQIRNDLIDYVNSTLPPEERGRFIGAITRALRRSDIVRGDPGATFRNAGRVMQAIENRAAEVYKTGVVDDIKSTLERTADSPGVDVEYRQRIRAAMEELTTTKPRESTLESMRKTNEHIQKLRAAGKDVSAELLERVSDLKKTPLKDLSIGQLESLRNKIELLERLGRQKVQSREIMFQREKSNRIKEMKDAESHPLEDNPIFKPQPGEKGEMGMIQRVSNWLKSGQNTASRLEKAHGPMDEIFDLLGKAKATYDGWLERNIRGPLDLAYNNEVIEGNAFRSKLREIAQRNKLTEDDFHQLFVHAASKMEGGKERLMEQGITQNTIDKAQVITKGQAEWYDAMRDILDKDLLPRIIDIAKALDNKEVKPLDSYVPFQRDWVETKAKDTSTPGELTFNEDATAEQILNDIGFQRLSTKTKQGFLEARQKGAKTPIKTNLAEVIDRHIADALHYIHSQPELRMAGEIVRGDAFAKKFGKAGQTIILDWLDTVARQGGVTRFQRLRALDWVRNATSKGQVGYRLASNLVHTSQVAYAVTHAGGPTYWARGMHEITTNPKAQEFIQKYAAETTRRSGGEPAQAEAELGGKIAKGGFYIARNLDRLNSQATFLGRYFKEMEKQGISPEQALDLPVDKNAQMVSLIRMRRAVASPLYKDVPQALSRGLGYGGNVSVARGVNQFRNIFLDNWSNLRHDFFRAGVSDAFKNGLSGDNASKIASIAAATMMSIAIETGVKYGVKKGIKATTAAVTGGPTPEDKGAVDELKHHTLNRIPVIGQLINAGLYGETGVPVIDALVKPVHEIVNAFRSKKPETRTKHALRAVSATGTLTGIPGIGQAADIAEQIAVPKITKKGKGGFELVQ